MVNDVVNEVLRYLKIEANLYSKDFKSYEHIASTHNGVYIITQGDLVIYVGKGQIRKRQSDHWNKAHGNIDEGKKNPSGWKWLRENIEITPVNWKVSYLLLEKQTELSAVEGMLIHLLQPLANDETFQDNHRTLKETK